MAVLTEENLHWQKMARQVANDVVRPLAKKYDDLQEYPWEIQAAIKEAGLFGVWIPEQYGGKGKRDRNVMNLCLVVEELSRACGGVGVLFAVNALGSFPILVGGDRGTQKKKYLPADRARASRSSRSACPRRARDPMRAACAFAAVDDGDGFRDPR